MTSVADTRPAGVDVWFRPGDPVTVTLLWPTGSLAGRSFASTLDDETLDVTVIGDTMTVEATDDQTTLDGAASWALTETTAGISRVLIVGKWIPDDGPRAVTTVTVPVVIDDIEIDVTLAGASAGVLSVNGETGAVTLTAADVGADPAGSAAAVAASVTVLGERVTDAETDIAVLGATDSALDSRLDTAEADITSLQNADTALDGRLDVLEAGTVNVRTFGAVGDGVADDTAEIQAAINAAPANGRVWFPPGTYLVSSPVRLRGGLTYEGPGHALASSAVIRQAPGANIAGANGVSGVLVANAWAVNADTCDEPIRVRHLAVDGNKSANPTSNAAGIVVISYASWVEDCFVHDTPSHGVLLTDVTADGTQISNSASENRIQRCHIVDAGGNGIHQVCANTISNQDGYCVDNVIAGGQDAIHYERGSGWVFRRNHTYGGTGHGIYLERCFATVVTENEVEIFGAQGGAGAFWAGISVAQLDGRGTHIVNNFVGCDEPDPTVGAYQYISVHAATTQADAHAVIADNIIHGPAVTSGQGIALVLQGDFAGSVLHAEVHGNRIAAVDTERYVSAGVNVTEPADASATGIRLDAVEADVAALDAADAALDSRLDTAEAELPQKIEQTDLDARTFWSRFQVVPVNGIDNAIKVSYANGVASIRGTGGGGNERRFLTLPDQLMADAEVLVDYEITAGAAGVGQTGLVLRRQGDVAVIVWQNIFFGATGRMLQGIWEYDGTNLADTNQQAGYSELWGSEIVSAVGNGTTVTVTTATPHPTPLAVGQTVTLVGVGSFTDVVVASIPTATTFTFSNATVGSWSGGRYYWLIAPATRRKVRARLVGNTVTFKQWLPGQDEPSWSDPVRTVTTTVPATLASGKARPTGLGEVGLVATHLGDGAQINVYDFQATSLDGANPAAPALINDRYPRPVGDILDVAKRIDNVSPPDHGLIAWSYDPGLTQGGTAPANGRIVLTKIMVRRKMLASNIHWATTAAGATPVAGQSHIALYDSAGVRVATAAVPDADITGAAGVRTTAITPVTLNQGFYWVAFLFNATTRPSLARATAASATLLNVGLTAARYRSCERSGTATALPATFDPATNVAQIDHRWAALS